MAMTTPSYRQYQPAVFNAQRQKRAIELQIHDTSFARKGTLSNYISLEWEEDWAGLGRLVIVCVDSPSNIALLQQGWYVGRKDRDTAMVIRYVKYDSQAHEITVRGYTTLSLLEQRTIYRTQVVGNAEESMRSIVQNNLRGLPDQQVAPSQGFTDVSNITQFTGDNVVGALVALNEDSGIGFRNVFDHMNGRHVFTVQKGSDFSFNNTVGNPTRIFSAEFKNLQNITIIKDMDIFRNVAFVAGEDTGSDRVWIEVNPGNVSGLDRFELFVDARDIRWNKDDGETEAEYKAKLYARGIEKLNKHNKAETFIGEVDSNGFGVDFSRGDIISCKSEKYRVWLNVRITRSTEVREENMTRLKLTLGEPEITLLQVVNL